MNNIPNQKIIKLYETQIAQMEFGVELMKFMGAEPHYVVLDVINLLKKAKAFAGSNKDEEEVLKTLTHIRNQVIEMKKDMLIRKQQKDERRD